MPLYQRLDARDRSERLLTLQSLRDLERRGRLNTSVKAGPVLPSYDHVHTTASYGYAIPGIHSVSRMIWAAHESRAYSTLIVEHESLAHCDEAREALAIVNRDTASPLRLALGVEFKATLAFSDAESRLFGERIAQIWGQGEAAWIVGVDVESSEELTRLVEQFQAAKRQRTEEQLERLNRHFALDPPLTLTDVATPEGNVTDRALCLEVARAKHPGADHLKLAKAASKVRAMLKR